MASREEPGHRDCTKPQQVVEIERSNTSFHMISPHFISPHLTSQGNTKQNPSKRSCHIINSVITQDDMSLSANCNATWHERRSEKITDSKTQPEPKNTRTFYFRSNDEFHVQLFCLRKLRYCSVCFRLVTRGPYHMDANMILHVMIVKVQVQVQNLWWTKNMKMMKMLHTINKESKNSTLIRVERHHKSDRRDWSRNWQKKQEFGEQVIRGMVVPSRGDVNVTQSQVPEARCAIGSNPNETLERFRLMTHFADPFQKCHFFWVKLGFTDNPFTKWFDLGKFYGQQYDLVAKRISRDLVV